MPRGGLLCTCLLHGMLLTSLVVPLPAAAASQALPFDLLRALIGNASTYNHIRPDADGPPVTVNCSLYITSLGSVEETTMDYTVTLFLRHWWNDERLAFTGATRLGWLDLSPEVATSVWKPDAYFSNEKSAALHMVTAENMMLRVFANGDVFYSVRLSLTLDCPMNLRQFPVDVVKCSIYLESYSMSTRDIVFRWSLENPVEYSDQITMPEFKLGDKTLHEDCTKNFSTGNFTCIRATFSLRRKIGYYMFQIYIPTLLIVIISWAAFWVNMESAPARVALGMTTILTMTTQSSGSRTFLPKLSYATAMDVWMTACMVFVFAAFLEYIAVTYALTNGHDLLLKLAECKEEEAEVDKKTKKKTEFGEKVSSLAQGIDNVSRVFFPICFLFFNLLYWSILLVVLSEGEE
ncbi:glycine receptor subunit alpha-2-like [Lethenteron reissneri]|uniref:glycine receptor subunit alpha-2-like n=1 Tax=Lethenteron reissneri TaxID=7753 RepID=UPI002AB7931A|nr:glycine receptor subunit alpha-2-like [Lethenteron reissneri]